MAGLAQVVEDCYHALKWLLPVVVRMPRSRRYSLGQQFEQHALQFLEGYTGYLQVEGYAGYKHQPP